jgi:hypothetical protein
MEPLQRLLSYHGNWSGEYRLWLDPDKPADVSRTELRVTPELDGRFVRLDYTWSAMGDAAAGVLLLGLDARSGAVTCAWIDSFHSSRSILFSEGAAGDGVIRVTGRYADPSGGPDWGWRTELEPAGERLLMRAFNIWPDGREDRAVEADYGPG